ncbi:MAG TPA: SDR family oxidoreductase [Nitrososphaeraceae archaeon]|nr:SDR family oxidoreductase [Nitrososphaeraceae archaeon]
MENDNSDGRTKRRQIALITGSSSGIGFETSLLLARNGIYTYATMRNLSKSQEILDIAKKECLPLKVLTLDVTDEKSTQKAIDMVMYEQNRIDVIVNNAGYSLVGALEQISMDEIKEEFETNFFGIIKLIQKVLPQMRKQRSGRIINVSSLAGRIGLPLASAYVSSKFALEGLSESLKYEIQDFGIYVILIEPGVIKTNFIKNLKIGKQVITSENGDVNTSSADLPYADISQKRISAFKPRFEKGSSPKEVADTILEAVTSDNPKFRYIVGQDASKLMEIRKNTSDEEFGKIVMNSVLEAQ